MDHSDSLPKKINYAKTRRYTPTYDGFIIFLLLFFSSVISTFISILLNTKVYKTLSGLKEG